MSLPSLGLCFLSWKAQDCTVVQRLAHCRCPEHLGRREAEPALRARPSWPPVRQLQAARGVLGGLPGRQPPAVLGGRAGGGQAAGLASALWPGSCGACAGASVQVWGGAKERSGRTPTCQGSPSGSVGWSQHPVPRGPWPCVAGHSPPLVGVAVRLVGDRAPGGDRVKWLVERDSF